MWVPSDFSNVRGILGKETNLSRRRGNLEEIQLLGFLFQSPEKLVVRVLVVLFKETKCLLFNL